jgi:hypothetical protein
MASYRIFDFMPESIAINIKEGYHAYTLFRATKANDWVPVKPSWEELRAKKLESKVNRIDPNILNRMCDYPPNYAVLHPKQDTLRKWVDREFKDVKIKSESKHDITFEGTHKGYADAAPLDKPNPYDMIKAVPFTAAKV